MDSRPGPGPIISCDTLGKVFNFSVPFPSFANWEYIYLIKLLKELKEIIYSACGLIYMLS